MPKSRYGIAVLAVIVVPPLVLLIQTLLRLLGPASSVPTTSEFLTPEALSDALQEPGERLTLLGWWGAAGSLAVILAILAPRYAKIQYQQFSWTWRAVLAVLGCGSFVLLLAAGVGGHDPDGTWPGIGLTGLAVGLGLSALVFGIWSWRKSLALIASLALVIAVTVIVGRGLVQTPDAVGDPYHSSFVAEEIASVAAGRFPLSTYVPQYTVLLGFPIAPVIGAWPGYASFIVIAWLVALQVICLFVAVFLAILQGGWRFLAPAALVALPPTVVSYAGGYAPATSFSAFPIRPILPVLAILITYLILRGQRHVTWPRGGALFGAGLVGGLAMLNNPDHGMPALLALLAVALLASSTWRSRWVAVGSLAAGGLLPMGFYSLLGSFTGNPVDWSMLVAFPRIFGSVGYAAVPMQPFGLHIAFVSLFALAVITGVVLLVRSPRSETSFAYRQGLLLLLTGGWAFLTVLYFVGRSVPVTGVGNYAFAAGLVGAAFLPLLAGTLRALQTHLTSNPLLGGLALLAGVVMICLLSGSIVMARQPSISLVEAVQQGIDADLPPVAEQRRLLLDLRSAAKDATFADALRHGQVAQLLPVPNLTALISGIPSVALTSSDEYFELSGYFADAQCRLNLPEQTAILLTSRQALAGMGKSEPCMKRLAMDRVHVVSEDYVWVEVR